MPELPEVEVLVRYLRPVLKGRVIKSVAVHRRKVIRPTTLGEFCRSLTGARFMELERRGKYLLFTLRPAGRKSSVVLVGHLGMTGRMYLTKAKADLPKHAAVVLELNRGRFVFEDTRYFGRLTLDTRAWQNLGPEPLSDDFTVDYLGKALSRSSQAIKVRLLDQSLVAGVGNIYASEALFLAGISPRRRACKLKSAEVGRLREGLRAVLTQAIEAGSTVPLNWSGENGQDGLFYYGSRAGAASDYVERLSVYDRQGEPCLRCGGQVERLVQAARSTFYCRACQS